MVITEIIRPQKRVLFKQLVELRPIFIIAAQDVYNQWDDIGDGWGICGDISEIISEIVNKYSEEFHAVCESGGVNKSDTHNFALAFSETESYLIDIPYWKYEKYGLVQGWVKGWKKLKGVKFTEKDVRIVSTPRLKFMDEPYYRKLWKRFRKNE